MALLQQLLQGKANPSGASGPSSPPSLDSLFASLGANQAGSQGAPPGLEALFGARPGSSGPGMGSGGGPAMGGMLGSMGSMLGSGSAAKKKSSDSFFTDRLPFLERLRRPWLVAFFAFAYWRGWIGRYGLVQGAMGKSFFDVLAVPLRILPRSPFFGKAIFVTQLYADSAVRLAGFLINLARGKTTLRDAFKPPPGFPAPGGPFASAASAAQPPWGMPTRTTGSSSPRPSGVGSGSQTPPTIVDADVTFLD